MDQESATTKTPQVWALLGQKAGDNNQILALAAALGWGWCEKHLQYIDLELIPNRLFRVTLLGLRKDHSDPLEGPWPDLVISAGRRNEPVARWIKRQSLGQCKLVHMGRPWARPKHFDLIVTTPQYNLPQAPNILYNELPLHRIDAARLKVEGDRWQKQLAHLPKPWIAVLVGGDSSFCRFTAAGMRYLGRSANALASAEKGSLLITTSARTPAGALAIIKSEIDVPTFCFEYSAGSGSNPYHGFLALADSFIVTAESTSMLTESCATNKPIHVYDGTRPEHAGDPNESSSLTMESSRPGRALGTWLRDHLGPKRLRRDVTRIHHNLIRQHRIQWLGENRPLERAVEKSSDLENSVVRVRQLFG